MSYSLYTKNGLEDLEKTLNTMNGDAKIIGQTMIDNMKGYDVYHNKEMRKKDIEIAKLEGYIEGLKKSIPSKPDTASTDDDNPCTCKGFQRNPSCRHHGIGY